MTDDRQRLLDALKKSTAQTIEAQALVRTTMQMVRDERKRAIDHGLIMFGIGGIIGTLATYEVLTWLI